MPSHDAHDFASSRATSLKHSEASPDRCSNVNDFASSEATSSRKRREARTSIKETCDVAGRMTSLKHTAGAGSFSRSRKHFTFSGATSLKQHLVGLDRVTP